MKDVEYTRLSERWLGPKLEGRWKQAELALYAVAIVAGWWTRMVQDDAFITFRYARNLAQGHGFVYNPGEKVEGYTNFLWTLVMWIPEKAGWDTPTFSVFVTIALMVITVGLALRFARKVFGGNEALAFLSAAALLANFTFIGYGTSGLETMLQTLCVTAVALLLVPHEGETTAKHRAVAGVFAGLAILTRLDSVVIVATWFLLHCWWLLKKQEQPLAKVAVTALQMGSPVLVLVVPWLVWKSSYYGDLLPNTLAAKSWGDPFQPFLVGVLYLVLFFGSYWAFVFIGRARRLKGTFPAGAAKPALALVVGAWFLYICVVGADFMEFRFVVPVLPILAMYAAWLLDHMRSPRRHLGLVALLLLVSVGHRVAPPLPIPPVFTFEELKHWPDDDADAWEGFGKMLHEEFPGGIAKPGQVILGIIPAGAVPYYAELPAVDMLGLNDEWTAENGLDYPFYFPGHVRTSTVDYLLDRRVNLVLGSMRSGQMDPDRTSFRLSEIADIVPAGDLANLPYGSQVIEVPYGENDRAWRFIYLTQSDAVDAAIERNDWPTYPIEQRCDEADFEGLAKLFAERTCPDI